MATARSETHRPYSRPPERDLISDLPDDLLHAILAGLRSADAAARTSILSRRWRRVWAHLPALSFIPDFGHPMTPTQVVDRVDAALHARAAAGSTVNLLEIWAATVTADRVAPWLRFASQRLAGGLWLSLQSITFTDIELPQLERASSITLFLSRIRLRFNLPPAGGAFTALATMLIRYAHVDGSELDGVLSARCPNLKELTLEYITADGDLFICSDTITKKGCRGGRKPSVGAAWSIRRCATVATESAL
ncbi:hypothetical protein EJB05_11913, partial [Eragrostis curvula]